MRIALLQLDANEVEGCATTGVLAARIFQLVEAAHRHNADLVVFPEGYPFIVNTSTGEPPTLSSAISQLQKLPHHPLAFVLGGYVMESERPRNASFLVHNGNVHAPYFKRVPWLDEPIESGTALLRWSWDEHQVIPLICADVCVPWNSPDGRAAQMLGDAAALGAGPLCPLIVSTFGADLRKPYWTEPLRAWARACNAPVLVSAVAGRSVATFEEDGEQRRYGGGGSGMYWFEEGQDREWPSTEDSEAVAMYVLDTMEPKSCWIPLDP